jgi:hypothetical protein
MKTMKSMGFLIDQIPDETVCNGIMNNGRIHKLSQPAYAKDLRCGICGGDRGFEIKSGDPNEQHLMPTWSCIEFDCMQTNAGRHDRVRNKK